MNGIYRLRQGMQRSRAWVFMAAVVFFVLAVVLSNPWLKAVLPWLSIASLAFAWPDASKTGKILTSSFLIGGFALLILHHDSGMTMVQSFGSMLNLLSLFTAVPLLALPLQSGNYRDAVERLLTGRPLTPRRFQWIVSAVSYLLSILMNIGAIPMMYSIVSRMGERFGQEDSNRFLIPSIVSGYTMPLLWSPVAAVLAAVVSETKIHWATMFPVSFGLSLLGIGLSNLWWRPHPATHAATHEATHAAALDKSAPFALQADSQSPSHARGGRLWEIGMGIAIFVVCMFTLQAVFDWPIGAVIALLAFPFSLLWSALIGKRTAFFRSMTGYRTAVENLSTTFSVFTGAGFFVTALARSGYTHALDRGLLVVSHAVGPVAFLAFIPWLIVLLALMGLHPVVSIALLSGVFHPSLLHLARLWLSVGLLGGGVSTFILSPFMATLTVAGTVSGERPAVIMRWTAGYALAFLVLCDLVACLGQALS